jgi:hypothetical protein
MTIAVKVAATALALTAIVVVGTIGGLVLMIHTRERKITTWAGDEE